MDFFEAMALMKTGSKVRLKSWQKEKYIGVKEEEIKTFGKKKIRYSVINFDESDLSPCIPFASLVCLEWEEFKED